MAHPGEAENRGASENKSTVYEIIPGTFVPDRKENVSNMGMEKVDLATVRERLTALKFEPEVIEKAIVDATEASKKSDAIYLHKDGFTETVIRKRSDGDQWYMQAGAEKRFPKAGSAEKRAPEVKPVEDNPPKKESTRKRKAKVSE